ncbi:OprO/OprP family phosphate-selective porin [Bosea eneae]|uniref:OprO/OprP family phosphate-selective porin n=1 Tax=Bosea eneae TaxID=151454 RepID=A0ABW0J0S8_9HYPH|nr:porin [Methylobacterium sp.]MBY0296709.1 OprO/OprP family phosphate-selective porin [Methylobacterium sp.]
MALGLVILANPAAAQKDGEIQAMKQEIRTLQQQLNAMQRRVAARPEPARKGGSVAKGAEGAVVAAPPSLGGVTFPNGRPTLTSADGNFSLGIYGRVQSDVGTYFDEVGRDFNDGWNFRRARLGAVGSIWKDFTYSLIYDFGGSPDGAGSLYEASLGYTGVKRFNFRIGAYKPFFSLEDSISSADLLFHERASIVEIARSVAAGTARMSAGGSVADEGYFVSAYLTGPTVGVEANDEQVGGVARVAFQPFRGPNYLVHVGASGAAAFAPTQNAGGVIGISRRQIQLRDRPEIRIDSTRLIDTGLLSYRDAYTVGFELAGHVNNFSLQGEYYAININQDRAPGLSSPNLTFDGYYVQGSWIITGESRRYNTNSAAYAAPRVANPVHAGGWGAWELVGRYSYANLNDKDVPGRSVTTTGSVRGGEQTTYTVGLNWYPNQNVRFMLNYVNGNVDRVNAAGTAQIGQSFQALALRSQFSF